MVKQAYEGLRKLDRSSARRVTVEVSDGVIRLFGDVPAFYTRQIFVSFCRRLAGVVSVEDELRVQKQSDSFRSSRSQVRSWL